MRIRITPPHSSALDLKRLPNTLPTLTPTAENTKVVAASDRIDRIENVKDIKNYIERIDEMIERKRQGFLKYGK